MFSISIRLLHSWRLASTIDSSLASTTVTISFDEIKDDTGVALFVAEGFLGVSAVPSDTERQIGCRVQYKRCTGRRAPACATRS